MYDRRALDVERFGAFGLKEVLGDIGDKLARETCTQRSNQEPVSGTAFNGIVYAIC
jgi:hypothetical protein